MHDSDAMKPVDCQDHHHSIHDCNSLDYRIKLFNIRNPLIQLRFNVHDCYYRLSCFKNGPECRTELP